MVDPAAFEAALFLVRVQGGQLKFNMLKITVQEAFAFDLLSIYLLKVIKNSSDINNENYSRLLQELYFELGVQKVNTILNSIEYRELFQTNQNIFELVDKVKFNPCLGKKLDTENFTRYQKKQSLQKKYFNSIFTEQKFFHLFFPYKEESHC